jgi:putative PIN family toxin of toxin-antitoxin system
LVGAAIKPDSVPEQALLRARAADVIALSAPVEAEIMEVLRRPRLASAMSAERRDRVLNLVRDAAVRFEPAVRVTDCRDAKDNIYLELALAAGARIIVSSDTDLLVLHPWRGVRVLRPSEYLAIQSKQ